MTSLGGFLRYCLKRSSKAWPMVLMTSCASPSGHSRMWQAEGTAQAVVSQGGVLGEARTGQGLCPPRQALLPCLPARRPHPAPRPASPL